MAPKRNQPADSGCKWSVLEQKRLEELIEEGHVSVNDPAISVKDFDGIFEKFSNQVIGYHLGAVRKKKLMSAQTQPSGSGIIPPVADVLMQLGVVSPNSVMAPKIISTPNERSSGSYELVCDNMPFLRFSYMKYSTKQEKIVVLLNLPGGSDGYDWEFNDYGDAITIVVNWSKAMYDVTDLFKSALQAEIVTLDHPKLHAMQNEALKKGFSSKQIPKSRLQVDLGKRVHKDDGTWKVEVINHDGNRILSFEFSGFQEEILKTEKRGKFE